MQYHPISSGKRKPVNVSLDTGIVQAAREIGLNLSQTCEAALREAARRALREQWVEENRAAFAELDAWLDENGMPLAHLPPL